jgi:RecA-family ATPase
MNMAVSLAKGESFLRWESAKEKYKVLYLDFELAEWMIDERINAITKFGCPENLTTVCFQQLPDLANLSSLKKYVKEELAQDQYDLIIWDCLYRFIGNRDENSNADMAEVFGWFQGFRTITGATQLIIHHFGKGDHSGKSVNDCFRGASAISGAVDSAVALSAHEEKDHFIVKQISRGFAQQDPFVVHWKYPKFEVTEKDPSKHRRPGAEQKVSDGEIVDYVTCLNRPTDAKSIGEALQLTQQQAKPRLDGLVLQRLLNATKGRPRKYTAAKSRMKETL